MNIVLLDCICKIHGTTVTSDEPFVVKLLPGQLEIRGLPRSTSGTYRWSFQGNLISGPASTVRNSTINGKRCPMAPYVNGIYKYDWERCANGATITVISSEVEFVSEIMDTTLIIDAHSSCILDHISRGTLEVKERSSCQINKFISGSLEVTGNSRVCITRRQKDVDLSISGASSVLYSLYRDIPGMLP